VLDESLKMIDFARDHGVQVRFAAEDASRTDIPFLKEVYLQAAEHGAALLSFADTVGCLIPSEMHRIMTDLVASVDRPFCATATMIWGVPLQTRLPLPKRGVPASHNHKRNRRTGWKRVSGRASLSHSV